MGDEINLEIAHKLVEPHAEHRPAQAHSTELLEIAEAVVLALVAVATAWSGYNSAQWDGRQSELYSTSMQLRVEAAVAGNEGRQILMFDALTLNAWLDARMKNDAKLIAAYERRFTPEFRVAVNAWLKTDPFNDPRAPTRPFAMPEYHNAGLEKSAQLTREADAAFTAGTQARATSDKYVRITVLLATVLFLTAIAQRFKIRKVRVGVFGVAVAIMVYALSAVAMYPRL
jgi:hypothetical protein